MKSPAKINFNQNFGHDFHPPGLLFIAVCWGMKYMIISFIFVHDIYKVIRSRCERTFKAEKNAFEIQKICLANMPISNAKSEMVYSRRSPGPKMYLQWQHVIIQ